MQATPVATKNTGRKGSNIKKRQAKTSGKPQPGMYYLQPTH
jgi:hypothetical protein